MSTLTIDSVVCVLEIRGVDHGSPARARSWLTQVLEDAGVSEDDIDTAVLLVSELVTNAFVHTDSARILVSAQLVDGGIRLVVHDDAAPADDWDASGEHLDERGRGLVIVQAISAEFQVDRHPFGTTVTALIPTNL